MYCIYCFDAQQAAKKFLKAYLVLKKVNPITHDFKILINI